MRRTMDIQPRETDRFVSGGAFLRVTCWAWNALWVTSSPPRTRSSSAPAPALGGMRSSAMCMCSTTARRRPDVLRAAGGAWAVFADGAPVAWYQRRLGIEGAHRVGGPDLMLAVVDRGRRAGLRHALFGSTPEVAERLSERLKQSVSGRRDRGRAHA